MRTLIILFLMISISSVFGQSKIITSPTAPLTIEGPGLKFTSLTSASTTQPANGKLLTVDANGLIYLAPATGTSQWTTNSGSIYYSGSGLTNVGIGTNSPLQRLHVDGSVNVSNGSYMFGNAPFLRSPVNGNLFIGLDAGKSWTTGYGGNTILGNLAGQATTDGYHNTFIGYGAGFSNGYSSGNVFVGAGAGYNNTTGGGNIFVGLNAGKLNTTGIWNTFIGLDAGGTNTTGTANVLLGRQAGVALTMGNNNALMGNLAGAKTTTGENNTFLGVNSGLDNVTGSNNIAIGNNSKFGSGSLTNAIAIGTGSLVSISDAVVIGNSTSKIGFGTESPAAKLEVKSFAANTSGLRFTNLTSSSSTVSSNGKVLSVNATGDVILVPTTSGMRIGAEEGFWTENNSGILQNSNEGGVVIGKGVASTPYGYNLYVSNGILTEKVKVALKSTAEWSDFVFSKNYKLASIESVEKFIKRNNHLPEVPSAEEMVKEGNDLVKTDAILLKKIEELTLYVIELKKEITKLQQK